MGLQTLIPNVLASLEAAGYTGISVIYGRRELTKQVNQGTGRANRVVFCPAKTPGTITGGTVGGPRSPGQPKGAGPTPTMATPGRSLHTWQEPIEVHCWAWDSTTPNDELANDDAARALAMATMRAIYLSASSGHGSYELKSPRWTTTPVERKFGSEVTFDLHMQIRVEDIAVPAASPNTVTGFVSIILSKPDQTAIETEVVQVPTAP